MGLYPAKLEENTECLLCGQCLKACDRNNPGLGVRPNPGWFRRPWFKDILQLKPLTNAQAAFCLIVSGFVVYELFTEWPATKSILLWLPTSIERVSGAGGIWRHGLITSLTLFFGLPTLFWLLPLAAFLLAGGQLRARDYTLRFGIAFIPIMAAAHAIKALLKMTSRIPYWRHAASDPIGTETARSLLANATQLSSLPAWCEPAITVLSLALMAAGVTASLAVVQKLIAEHLLAADAVLVGHTHFDHALDVPSLSRRTGCPVYGSRSLCRLMAVSGLADRTVEVECGVVYPLGPFEVTFVESIHSKIILGLKVPYEGEFTCSQPDRLSGREYRCGSVYGIHIAVAGATFYHMGSANLLEERIRHRDIDTLLVGISGRGFTPDFTARALRAVSPRVVVPHHYDAFFRPLSQEMKLAFNVNFVGFAEEVRAVSGDIAIRTLDMLQTVERGGSEGEGG